VRIADAEPRGIVVLSDTGDTVFGGSAGDSNLILEAMIRLKIKSKALVPLISPGAAKTLSKAGEGAQVTLLLGGDAATAFFTPIEVTARCGRSAAASSTSPTATRTRWISAKR
jgi:microcystin degradation protein MlrC